MLKLLFGADFKVEVVPELVFVIAASIRSVKMSLVGQKIIYAFERLVLSTSQCYCAKSRLSSIETLKS